MIVILIYRPEADSEVGCARHDAGPFEGIEVMGVAKDENEAETKIVEFIKVWKPSRETDKWQFSLEEI